MLSKVYSQCSIIVQLASSLWLRPCLPIYKTSGDRLNKANMRASETPEQLLEPLMQLPCVTARLVLLAPSITHGPAYSDATTHAHSRPLYAGMDTALHSCATLVGDHTTYATSDPNLRPHVT